MPSIDPLTVQSIQWGSETLARCFSLRGLERGYGVKAGDEDCAREVTAESQRLADHLWLRAVDSHEQAHIGFGVATNFDRLVLDMCAHHRRNVAGWDRN